MTNERTLLITGASSGIGYALALVYAARGTRLLLTGRDISRLERVASDCRTRGAEVEISTVPVTDKLAFGEVIEKWDNAHPIDIVIANAGISGGSAAGAGFYGIVQTNLDGTLHTVMPLIERMKARKSGHIALMSSMAGWRGMPNAPAYSVSKMAVRALGEALRPLLAPEGVKVSVIFPGFIKTPLTDVNNFTMPFLMDAEKAAACIKKGIEKNRARIAFPLPMLILSRLVAALPLWLGDRLLARAPKKPD
jgi:short-subunit dehydrogenase